MFNEIIESVKWGDYTLTIKTGKVARQSSGAVMVSMGDTVVLCTTVSAREVKADASFFPLTIHYREMAFAAGKIPGGFFKREGKATEREVLVSRLIDRPLRPLFAPSFFNETQVICTVLSYDERCPSDILAIVGASAALAISGVPYMEIAAAAKVGYVDGEYVLNPSTTMLVDSKLDLVVAGTNTSVMMVESEANELSEEQMLGAVEFGHKSFQPIIKMIESLVKKAGKPRWDIPAPIASEELIKELTTRFGKDIEAAYKLQNKQERVGILGKIQDSITLSYADHPEISALQLLVATDEVKAKVLRGDILSTGIRLDGRKSNEIRPIDTDVSILPKTHGSALFTRGETQGLVVATLGTTQDEQIIDGLEGDSKERFLLHYIFPPYSVGEASPFRAPGRREVGHGKLAWRALNAVLPSKAEFPYTVRVVSEITESNGSSSMATVCGGSLAMMDAGVPLKAPVSGIAMGLIKEGDKFIVLSDILGDEDYLGDMDFKVAGTETGITALQMDIKVTGITIEIMKKALADAKVGRMHILSKMAGSITTHRTEVSKHAPVIQTFKIAKDKIREVIGSGGKVIKEICEITGAKVDITDDGTVQVAAVGADKLNDAIARIKAIASEPEIGQIFEGTVAKVLESGAFINYLPGKDGFIHISEISDERIANINDHLKEGGKIQVKIIGVDPKGKAKLSMRLNFDHASLPPQTRDNRDRGGRPDRGNFKNRDSGAGRNDRRENFNKENRDDSDVVSSKTEEEDSSPRKRKVAKKDSNSSPSENSGIISEKKYFS